MALVRKISRIGNSQGILLPQAVIQQLNWQEDSELELRINGSELTIVPHRYATESEFENSATKVFASRQKLLRRLAR